MRRALHTASIVAQVLSGLVTFVGVMWLLWSPTISDFPPTEPLSLSWTGLVLYGLSYWLYCATETR